jgi:hypothetical protein
MPITAGRGIGLALALVVMIIRLAYRPFSRRGK